MEKTITFVIVLALIVLLVAWCSGMWADATLLHTLNAFNDAGNAAMHLAH